jgi:hypothetical protein
MAVIGMRVELAEDVLSRLKSTSARSRLQTEANNLRVMVYKTHNPAGYGIEPGDKVLNAYALSLANGAISAINRAVDGLDSSIALLRADIDGQKSSSVAQGIQARFDELLKGSWELLYPMPRVFRQYTAVSGRVTYGSVVRSWNDPRKNMTNRIVSDYVDRPEYRNITSGLVDGIHAKAPWMLRLKTGGDKLVKSMTTAIANGVKSIAPAATHGALKVGARLLGPAGIIIGGVLAFGEGREYQFQRDEGKGYTAAESESRANTRGAIKAVATTVGSIAGAAAGAAVLGPVGAVLGGMLGGWLGGMAGDAISNAVLD